MNVIFYNYPIRSIFFQYLSPSDFTKLIRVFRINYQLKYELYYDYLIITIKNLYLVKKSTLEMLIENVILRIKVNEELISIISKKIHMDVTVNYSINKEEKKRENLTFNMKSLNDILEEYDRELQLEYEYKYILKNIDVLYKIKNKPYLINDYNLYRLIKILKIYFKNFEI